MAPVKSYTDKTKPRPRSQAGGLRPWAGHPVIEAFEASPKVVAVKLDWVDHGYGSQASARSAVFSLLKRKYPKATVTTSAVSDTELLFEVHGPRGK